jgi:bifunctional DNA-binding transcriptional regulator/antitoxin component of YhaV-PrlF toxin-antitoxin module
MEKKTSVQLSKSGQVNIPAAIRDVLHWQDGMELSIKIISSGLLIQPKKRQCKKRRLEELRGLLKHKGKPLSDEQLCAPVDYTETE